MRTRRNKDTGSLDSLLDTMTNVVGILVILLVVTQLGVRDAVSRISQSEMVSPEAVARAENQLSTLDRQEEKLRDQLAPFAEGTTSDHLPRINTAVEAARLQLKELIRQKEAAAKQVRAQLAAARQQKQQAEELKKEVQQLEEQLDEVEQRLAELRAQLAITPVPQKVAAKEIMIPNPRAAPQGATPVDFLCYQGRVFPADVTSIQDRAQKRATYLVSRYRLDRGKAQGIDGERLAEEFNKEKIRGDYVELGMKISGNRPMLVLHPRKDVGESIEDLQKPTSRYRRLAIRLDPAKQYLRFTVWPESFEVYLAARVIAAERNIPAGWTPKSSGWQHMVALGGPLRVGPPSKPKPPPKEPAKPPPPKPVDQID